MTKTFHLMTSVWKLSQAFSGKLLVPLPQTASKWFFPVPKVLFLPPPAHLYLFLVLVIFFLSRCRRRSREHTMREKIYLGSCFRGPCPLIMAEEEYYNRLLSWQTTGNRDAGKNLGRHNHQKLCLKDIRLPTSGHKGSSLLKQRH